MDFGIVILLISYVGGMGLIGILAIVAIVCLAVVIVSGLFFITYTRIIEPWKKRREKERKTRKNTQLKMEIEERRLKREAEQTTRDNETPNITP